MPSGSATENALPDLQTIMAAVIRLMARCSTGGDVGEMRTLVRLIGTLREHPQLPRHPAVLASLVEANAIWVAHLAHCAEADALVGHPGEGHADGVRRIH